MDLFPDIEIVKTAAARIAPYVHRTPVFTSATVDRICGKQVFFKCESLQKVGAFKARGAVNAVLSLAGVISRVIKTAKTALSPILRATMPPPWLMPPGAGV